MQHNLVVVIRSYRHEQLHCLVRGLLIKKKSTKNKDKEVRLRDKGLKIRCHWLIFIVIII